MGMKKVSAASKRHLVDGKYALRDLVDIGLLRDTFENFSKATGLTTGLVSYPDQEVLIATGWRDVCTKFHRTCPDSARHCTVSNKALTARLKKLKTLNIMPCDNGLVDGATPILVKGVHVASLATGQLFLEKPDLERFRRQAERYGYDVDAYLKAVDEVPVISVERLRSALSFLGELAAMIGELGLRRLDAQESTRIIEREREELRRTEDALRKTTERLEMALAGADLGIWDWNIVTGEVAFDKRWSDMLGYAPEEIVPHVSSWERRVHPEDRDRVTMVLNAHLEGRTPSYETEHRIQAKTGEWKWILDKGKVIERDTQGRALRAVGTHLDITERVQDIEERAQLDRQIQQAQKAESLGRMAGAIAHHFNNQLAVVLGNLEMALPSLPPDNELTETISNAMKGASRAAEVSRLMLTYLGQTPLRYEPHDLSQICIDSIPMIKAAMPAKVVLATDLSSPGPVVRADAGQIRQVLMNLATNAWEAIGNETGRIGLSIVPVCAEDIPGSFIFHLDWQPRENAYACLTVSDTGCGMARDVLATVFDPFFSTKFTGRGLGLAVTAGIVKAHHGGICAQSEPGKGSSIRVYFPMVGMAAEPEGVYAVPIRKKGKVLLADDDTLVRGMTSAIMKRLGYEVIEASDGNEALEKFRRHEGEISCALLDLAMPRMDGWETMQTLRVLRPDIPVILLSGFDEPRAMSGVHGERPLAFLQKPFKMKDLKAVMEQAMAGSDLLQQP